MKILVRYVQKLKVLKVVHRKKWEIYKNFNQQIEVSWSGKYNVDESGLRSLKRENVLKTLVKGMKEYKVSHFLKYHKNSRLRWAKNYMNICHPTLMINVGLHYMSLLAKIMFGSVRDSQP